MLTFSLVIDSLSSPHLNYAIEKLKSTAFLKAESYFKISKFCSE